MPLILFKILPLASNKFILSSLPLCETGLEVFFRIIRQCEEIWWKLFWVPLTGGWTCEISQCALIHLTHWSTLAPPQNQNDHESQTFRISCNHRARHDSSTEDAFSTKMPVHALFLNPLSNLRPQWCRKRIIHINMK